MRMIQHWILLSLVLFFLVGAKWSESDCQKVDLSSIQDKKLLGKKLFLDIKFLFLQDNRVGVWEAPINFYLAKDSGNLGAMYDEFKDLPSYSNIRVFGKLRFVEDNQNYIFKVYRVKKYKNDLELFREEFNLLRQREPDKIKKFYQLGKNIREVIELRKKKKKKDEEDPAIPKLSKLHLRILRHALIQKEKQSDLENFESQLEIAKDYLYKAEMIEKAREKFLHCYRLKPQNSEVISILKKRFKLRRYRENGEIQWLDKEGLYGKLGWKKVRQRWYPPHRYDLMKVGIKRETKSTFFTTPSASQQKVFAREAKKTGKVKKRYGREAVIAGWGYPLQVLKTVLKNKATIELWIYNDSKQVFFEQGPGEKFARVIKVIESSER